MGKMLVIDKDTSIIIFGAGFTGYRYYELLKDEGLKVSCFIDWNANKLNPRNETRILKPDDVSIDKENAVVIIGLANVFQHEEIVKQLSNLGYSFFLYYDINDMRNKGGREAEYERFTQGETIINKTISQYECRENIWEKNIEIKENEVTVSVPFELVYLASEFKFMYLDERREYFKDRKKKSIFINKALIDLYEIFERGVLNDKDLSVLQMARIYKRNMESGSYQEDIFEEQFNEWLCSRYMVWQMMTRKLAQDSSFFSLAAPWIQRNERGIFEEKDGNNRASFFMAKRIYRMPYRMSRADYESWINRKVLKKIISYISENSISQFPYPIPHPFFYSFTIEREIYGPKRLISIYDFLEKKGWNSKGKKIFDINGKAGYYAFFFGNMGAKSTIIEEKDEYRELDILLNELFYQNVGIRTSHEYISGELKCDLAIVSKWNKTPVKKEHLYKIMDSVSTGIVLEVEHEEIYAIENDEAVQNSYEVSQILKELVGDRVLATLVLWKKEKQ